MKNYIKQNILKKIFALSPDATKIEIEENDISFYFLDSKDEAFCRREFIPHSFTYQAFILAEKLDIGIYLNPCPSSDIWPMDIGSMLFSVEKDYFVCYGSNVNECKKSWEIENHDKHHGLPAKAKVELRKDKCQTIIWEGDFPGWKFLKGFK